MNLPYVNKNWLCHWFFASISSRSIASHSRYVISSAFLTKYFTHYSKSGTVTRYCITVIKADHSYLKDFFGWYKAVQKSSPRRKYHESKTLLSREEKEILILGSNGKKRQTSDDFPNEIIVMFLLYNLSGLLGCYGLSKVLYRIFINKHRVWHAPKIMLDTCHWPTYIRVSFWFCISIAKSIKCAAVKLIKQMFSERFFLSSLLRNKWSNGEHWPLLKKTSSVHNI